jgi:hypothetical protein
LNRAVESFNRAIEVDPCYTLAYAGLSDCYTKLGDVGVTAMKPREAFLRGRAAALKALELDGELAEAHASLGTSKCTISGGLTPKPNSRAQSS